MHSSLRDEAKVFPTSVAHDDIAQKHISILIIAVVLEGVKDRGDHSPRSRHRIHHVRLGAASNERLEVAFNTELLQLEG